MTTDTRRARTGLGRGLASLIPVGPADDAASATPDAPIREVAIDQIVANPYQPRREFDPDDLRTLADSIRTHGVLQPVLVTETPTGLRLVAGERRLRASQLAGRTTIPAVVRTTDDEQQLALALVENLQRADLNALDEALAFRRLIDEFGLTQEQVALQVGRSRASIANTIRLLSVADAVQEAVRTGRISEGHARALAAVADHDAQARLLAQVEQRGLSVRQTEQLVRTHATAARGATRRAPATAAPDDPDLDHMTAQLREALGTKVVLSPGRKGGRIIIDWYESDDLMRLYERLAGGDE